jgi:hypothetical protein
MEKQQILSNLDKDLINKLSIVKRPISTAPTHLPKNILEQFELYENGTTYRLYVYINGWHYITLT